MEQFIMAQGIPVRICDNQKGENAIVLLHGYLETLSVWDEFADKLAEYGYRTICIDIPGHGLSGTNEEINSMGFIADVLNECLNKLKISNCFVTGHSMGAYVALAFAKKYPEKIKALCLFHSTPNPDSEEKKLNREREIELIKEGKIESIIRVSIPRMFANDNVKQFAEKIQEIEENATVAEHEGIIACLRGMKEREDMNLFLKDFEKPLLFIFGKKDNYTPIDMVNELIERFPNAQNIMLENSGHAGFIEEHKVSLDLFVQFAQKVFL